MENKRNSRRKNRKIKFSEDRYVERNYMKGSKAIIPVELTSMKDLYMKHDYKQMELSDEICKYIEEIAYMIPINTDIILEIHSPRFTEEEQDKIAKSIKNNYGIEMDDVDYDINLDNRKTILLSIVGILILIFNILTYNYLGEIISNFICVIWWVAIWDVVEILLFDKNEKRWKRLSYQQLYDAKVKFVFDDEEEEKED